MTNTFQNDAFKRLSGHPSGYPFRKIEKEAGRTHGLKSGCVKGKQSNFLQVGQN
jgi:hypothetical protein